MPKRDSVWPMPTGSRRLAGSEAGTPFTRQLSRNQERTGRTEIQRVKQRVKLPDALG